MRKKIIKWIVCLVLLAGLGAGAWFGWQYYNATWLRLGGAHYRRDTQFLDLSGKRVHQLDRLTGFYNLQQIDLRGTKITVEEYEQVRAMLPECQLLWELPLQGKYYPCDTTSIQLEKLSDRDVELLDYLPDLTMVDAWDCRDYDQLLALEARRPRVKVLYYVKLGESNWSRDISDVTLTDVNARELRDKLSLLPGVKKLHVTGKLPAWSDMETLMEENPGIQFTWDVPWQGTVYSMDETSMDLSGTTAKLKDYQELIRYLPKLESVNMKNCKLSQKDMKTLCAQFPEIFFLWDVELFERSFSTDVVEIDISENLVEDVKVIEDLLPLFPNLKQVVMCDCGVENEDMDALNKRHENVKFVWSVLLGQQMFRTDITNFMPVKYGFKAGDYSLGNLVYCHDMECLDLGHQDVYKIEWAREMPNLRFLLLGDTHVSDISPLENHTKLVYLELFLTAVRDTTPLVSCTALEDLNICYTAADPEPVTQMTWLKRVWWAGSWLAQTTLPQALPDTYFEFATSSSTGKGWREGKLYYEQRDILGMEYMTG